MKSIVILSLLLIGCRDQGQVTTNTTPSTVQVESGFYGLVRNVGHDIIVPAYKRLERDVTLLKKEVDAQCSLKEGEQFERANLKKLFLNAMRSYHFVEAFSIGIIAEDGYFLKESIYSWPQSNNYLIDTNVAENKDYKVTSSAMGFPTLEYLIYEDKLLNICKDCGVSIMETWNQLPKIQKIQSRCNYMKFVAGHLVDDIHTINKAWNPPKGDLTRSLTYRKNFKTAKNFAIELAHGLNFFDKTIKDERLGIPAGISQGCYYESCPEKASIFCQEIPFLPYFMVQKDS